MSTNLKTNYVLLWKQKQVLLACTEKGLALPSVQSPAVHKWWREVGLIAQAGCEQLAAEVTVLRCIDVYKDSDNGPRAAIFLCEIRNAAWQPVFEHVWVNVDKLPQIEIANYNHNLALKTAFELKSNQNLQKWSQSDWFEEVAQWIKKQATAHGFVATGVVEQVRNHGFSSAILRLPTFSGLLYFKATPSLFAHEPALMQQLALDFPTLVPQVVAIDEKHSWLLMHGFQGVRFDHYEQQPNYLERWEQLLGLYATLQQSYAKKLDYLLALGLPDHRLTELPKYLENLLPQLPELLENSPYTFTVQERTRLRQAVGQIEILCGELAQLNLPDTINHGDFHSGNILANEIDCRLLDWAGFINVSNPFLGLINPLADHPNKVVQNRLCDFYLSCWLNYAPLEELHRGFEIAQILGLLDGALSHARQLPFGETSWQKQPDQENVYYLLKDVLKQLDKIFSTTERLS